MISVFNRESSFPDENMLKNMLREKQLAGHSKCIKCNKRISTKDDELCDSCRFKITLDKVIEGKEQ